MPPRAVSNRREVTQTIGLFKFHSTVFVFLTAWGVVLKSPHGYLVSDLSIIVSAKYGQTQLRMEHIFEAGNF